MSYSKYNKLLSITSKQQITIKIYYPSNNHISIQPAYPITFIINIQMKKTSAVKVTKATAFNAKSYERGGVTQQQVMEIKQAFDLFDVEGTGAIDLKQLKSVMGAQGFQTKNQTLFRVFSQLEGDGQKTISFDQFFGIVTARASDKNSRQNLKKVFAFFDDEKTGFVSVTNLKRLTRQIGQIIDEQQLQQMIDKADLDNDGLVSEEEFYQIITKKGK